MEKILREMPIRKSDGTPGLLKTGDLGKTVEKELPLYDVNNIEDSKLLASLFRDYTFLASAYLLEPCDLQYKKTKEYGLGRPVLPKNIAVPLSIVAKKIGARPFMEYALSYSLYNWQKVTPSEKIEYENLKLIRAFSGSKSEHGFILVHVAMVAHSGQLVKQTLNVLDAAEKRDRKLFNQALKEMRKVLQKINMEMDTMWGRSYHRDYDDLRTFIMGTKNQPMFPNGVIYEGVSSEPQYFRGESGANDSMIPTADNLLQLTARMPNNQLTEILKDFRSYRPKHHNEWLQYVDERAKKGHVERFAMENSESAVLYLANLDQVREFRARHWHFTKEYILRHSNHPVATGGSPIVTWLPNQLSTVLKVMEQVGSSISETKLNADAKDLFHSLIDKYNAQLGVLSREVDQLKKKYPGQEFYEATKPLARK